MRFRLTAVAVATVAIASFAGTGSAGAAGCGNELFRVGPAALLPPCRAYEMVSTPEKNGGGVAGTVNLRVSPDGNSLGFYSTASFSDPSGASLISSYIARRGGDAWSTQNVEAPQVNPRGFLEFGSPGSSPDLTETLQASRRALAPGAIEGGSNLYLQDDLTGERRLVAAQEGAALFEDARQRSEIAVDGTSDWSNLLIGANEALTLEAVQGFKNLYEFDEGALRLAGRLPATPEYPQGQPAPDGAAAVGRSPMSEDGRRVLFHTNSGSPSGPVYLRIDGRETVAVSASQRAEDRGRLFDGTNAEMSADGSTVYFAEANNLVEGSETNGFNTLYRYDVATRTLSDVIPAKPTSGAEVGNILGVSADGGTVYFLADGILAPGGKALGNDGSNLYVLRNGQIRLIAALEEFSPPTEASVSSDGRYFAFGAATPIGEEAAEKKEEEEWEAREAKEVEEGKVPAARPCQNDLFHPGRCSDVYVYDAEAGQVACASCVRPQTAESSYGGAGALYPGGKPQVRSVLDDGTVFLDTPNALVPRDVNGLGDAYAWRAGVPQLISTGVSDQPSRFANSDASGKNVFFTTSQQLVPSDTDNSFDAYDARQDGGLTSQFPVSAAVPCEGEECRVVSPSPPRPAPSGGTTGETNCAGVARAAGAARRGSADLSRDAKAARKTAKRKGTKATARRARKLQKRAKAAARRARALENSAKTCQGGNR